MTSVYLVKDNGILVSFVSDETSASSQRELESSLLTGIGIGISATFLESIDHVVLTDRTIVYYQTFTFDDNRCVLIVANRPRNGTMKDINISSKMITVRMFLQERERWRILLTTRDSTPAHDEITRKLGAIFLGR